MKLTQTMVAVLLGALLAGCATTQGSQGVRGPVVYTDMETPQAEESDTGATSAQGSDDDAALDPWMEGDSQGEFVGGIAGTTLAARTLSTSTSLQNALNWTEEGLVLYDGGDHEAARQSLSDALIALHEVDLPPAMAQRGLAVLACCLSPEVAGHDPEAVRLALDASANPESAERGFIEAEVRRLLVRFGASDPGEEYLATFVGEVERYVEFYRGRRREFFERAYERKHKYWPTIQRILAKNNLPEELGYLPLVESGYSPRALSHADARGLWQFIPATGRRYGLRASADFWDVEKSTEAAAEYLLDLIGIFGSRSFLLATAAYNAGEGRILRCLRNLEDPFGGRSFWAIRGCVATETREYVPRILAAAIISRDPTRFGFNVLSAEESARRYDVVVVPEVTSLAHIGRLTGVDAGEIRTLNTDLASTARRTPGRNFPLYVPRGTQESLRVALARESEPSPGRAQENTSRSAPTKKGSRRRETATSPTYKVRSGDTLSDIASRHGISYRKLASANGLSAPYTLRVGQKLKITGASGPPRLVYTVQKGNTLTEVADLFAVRYRDIKRWNKLTSNRLRVGQELIIHPDRQLQAKNYSVRSGDSIARIARRHGVSTRSILTTNGLGKRSVIRPGEKLVVYVPE